MTHMKMRFFEDKCRIYRACILMCQLTILNVFTISKWRGCSWPWMYTMSVIKMGC